MKIFLVIIFSIIGTAIINANSIIDPSFIENNLRSKEIIVVQVPDFINFPEGYSIDIEFRLKESGQIEVLSISGNQELAGYVKTRIENINVDELKDLKGEKFNYNVVFRKTA